MIKVENLTKKYGDFTALRDVSFELGEGEVVGLLGPNGAGKTTLLRILVSYLKPTDGKVEIGGMNTQKSVLEQKIKSMIGYLPEQAPLYEDMLVREYLEFIGNMQGIGEDSIDSRVDEVVKKCGLKEKENAEITTLSKGYRQRVGIAQALIHNPKIVILDEPTTGLDPNQRIEIRDLIKEIGKDRTVILSSHILSEVQSTCSRVIIINHGKIVADGTPETLEQAGKGNTIIKIEVENTTADLLDRLNAISGVIGVRSEGNHIDIEVLKGDDVQAEVSKIVDVEIRERDEAAGIIEVDVRKNDIRAEVARVAVETGAGLLLLERKQTSLEDIFIELTNKENE